MHALGDDRRARANTSAIREPHPAILTCTHEAEAGAWLATEFVPTEFVLR